MVYRGGYPGRGVRIYYQHTTKDKISKLECSLEWEEKIFYKKIRSGISLRVKIYIWSSWANAFPRALMQVTGLHFLACSEGHLLLSRDKTFNRWYDAWRSGRPQCWTIYQDFISVDQECGKCPTPLLWTYSSNTEERTATWIISSDFVNLCLFGLEWVKIYQMHQIFWANILLWYMEASIWWLRPFRVYGR